MAEPNAFEQYMLEMVNRARLDPNAEAARFGTTLNANLAAGTLDATSKQPLAFNLDLIDAARAHSQWMVNTDTFSHTGAGGTDAGARMRAEGFTGSWGENIVWQGYLSGAASQATIDYEQRTLFLSAAHRVNMLNDTWREVGVGSVSGTYLSGNASFTTEDFGRRSGDPFLTGTVWTDTDGDRGYDMGEGRGGVAITIRAASGASSTFASMSQGGYQKQLAAGTYTVTFAGTDSATIALAGENVKLDFEGGDTLLSSVSATLGGAMQHGTLLGTDAITLAGTTGANILTGNAGANRLQGGAGNDTIEGGGGTDTAAFSGNRALYSVTSSNGVVTVVGPDGTDRLTAVEKLAFADKVIDSGTLATTSGATTTTPAPTPAPTEPSGVSSAGGGAITGSGTINGTSAADTLIGSAGNDTLDGKAGADRFDGKAGNDTYIVDNTGDVVVEAAGAGTDLVRTSVAHTLSANVESLVLTGAGNVVVTGNALANRLDGNYMRNQLFGGDGNDTLWGGGGGDTLVGGSGNDVFVFRSTGESVVVRDFANGLDRIDLSLALDAVGYTGTNPLGADIVRLAASGTGSTIAIDKDGAGTGAPIVIATLEKVGISLFDASDFHF